MKFIQRNIPEIARGSMEKGNLWSVKVRWNEKNEESERKSEWKYQNTGKKLKDG